MKRLPEEVLRRYAQGGPGPGPLNTPCLSAGVELRKYARARDVPEAKIQTSLPAVRIE